MREIKFRVFWQGQIIYDPYVEGMNVVQIMFGRDLNKEFPDWKIMQFTGVKDKNGREIYEGDILSSSIGDGEGIGVVKWIEERLCFRAYLEPSDMCLLTSYSHTAEVIGNIYENPELLK